MSAEEIIAQFRSGQIASKREATRRMVAGILREKIHLDSTALTKRICEQLENDPAIHPALERLFQRR